MGCTPAINKTPFYVAYQYTNLYCKGDFGTVYKLLSDKDCRNISRNAFIDYYNDGLTNSKKAIYKKRTCQLKEVKIVNDTTATGMFIIQTPDYTNTEISLFGKYYISAVAHPGANMTESIVNMKKSIKKVDNKLANIILSTKPSKIITETKKVQLIYENHKWNIFLNIKARIESDKLVNEGDLLSSNGKYKEAKEKFKQALEMYPDNTRAKAFLNILNSSKFKKVFEEK